MAVENKTYEDGTEYSGKWRNGLPDGFGKHVYADGSYYKGYYLEGLRNGQGTFESAELK
jgi:hypothetical protein